MTAADKIEPIHQAAEPRRTPAPDLLREVSAPDLRVCFFGDSFVAGVGDSSGLGWVGRVTAAARAAGHRMTSYNLGVRRETSVQVVERIASEAPPRLSDAEDARLVVSFGVNDTSEVNGLPRVSVEEGVRALQAVSQFIVAERVLMVGPPATADSAQNGRIQIRDRALSREAGRLGIRYISTFQATLVDASWQYEVATGDGYHPDSAGYRLLASLIEPALLEWLAPLGRQQRGLCIGS